MIHTNKEEIDSMMLRTETFSSTCSNGLFMLFRNWTEVFQSLCCVTVLFSTSLSVLADETMRFNFQRSINHAEYAERVRVQRLLYESSEAEFKSYRREQLQKYFEHQYVTNPRNIVSTLFNVTDYVDNNFNSEAQKKSIISPKLSELVYLLSDDEREHAKLEIVGTPFFSGDGQGNYYEQLDLLISKTYLDHLISHPGLTDITFGGMHHWFSFGERARFSPPDKVITYAESFLRKGYYKEIDDILTRQETAKVHIELHQQPTDYLVEVVGDGLAAVDEVISDLDVSDYKLIEKAPYEALISLNRVSAEVLRRDPRVKLIKDYEFHHKLELNSGRWQPLPLTKVRNTTHQDIEFVSQDKSGSYGHEQKIIIIESEEQLTEHSYLPSIKQFDFSQKKLVVYFHYESSGSIDLTPREPVWIDNDLVVVIDRYSPMVHTTDIKIHRFVYAVDKKIAKITFRSGSRVAAVKAVGDK